MRRRGELLKKANINLFAGDLERLQELHPRIGASNVIRLLVRQHLFSAGVEVEGINMDELELDELEPVDE